MPTRSDDKGTLTPRQVLDQAITGLENLRLMLEETETLAHFASTGLDSLPWADRVPAGELDDAADAFDLHDLGDPDADDPEDEDQALAIGRLQTLVIAESKAIRRAFRYCQRLLHHLRQCTAKLPRPISGNGSGNSSGNGSGNGSGGPSH